MGYTTKRGPILKPKKFDYINVVPFIDIMLVLLVIVLTTATFVAKGIIPVSLPKTSNDIKKKETKNLTITITKDGDIFFEKDKILKDTIPIKLQEYQTDMAIRINCDKEAKFDTFVYMLDKLKMYHFENIGIITKHE